MARVAENKLDVLGAGWNLTGPGPSTLGIGVLIEVPWAEMDKRHRLNLRLQDAEAILILGPDGNPAMQVEADFQVTRPPGVILGLPAVNSLAVNIGTQLPPGQRFRIQASVDDYEHPEWSVAFSTRPAVGPVLN